MPSKTIRLPGPDGPEITIDKPSFGRPRVSIGGHSIDRVAGTKAEYAIPMPDGTSRQIRLSGGWAGTQVIDSDGSFIELDRSLRPWETILVFVPIALIVVGGLVGGLFGGIAAGVNLVVARSRFPAASRLGGMVAVTVVAAVAWYGVALFVANRTAEVPTVATGDCLDGVGPSIALTAENAKAVDCATDHAGEVVGLSEMTQPAGSPFPGEAVIKAEALAACPTLFETYVGVAFETSRLNMFYAAPSTDTWSRDDRTIACIAIDPQSGVLTGSVKGTAQ